MSRLSHLVNLQPPPADPKRPPGPQSDWRRYQMHRNNAKVRGIGFELTFKEWLDWWHDTGHYHERGSKRGQYVMGRIGDRGVYKLGNIDPEKDRGESMNYAPTHSPCYARPLTPAALEQK